MKYKEKNEEKDAGQKWCSLMYLNEIKNVENTIQMVEENCVLYEEIELNNLKPGCNFRRLVWHMRSLRIVGKESYKLTIRGPGRGISSSKKNLSAKRHYVKKSKRDRLLWALIRVNNLPREDAGAQRCQGKLFLCKWVIR